MERAIRFSLSMLMLLIVNFAWANDTSKDDILESMVMGDTIDLALTISTPSPIACIGSDVDYTIQIINQGDNDAHNIEITNYIPVGMSLATTGNAGWTVIGNLAKMTITNPLSAGGFTTASITLTVDAIAAGATLQNAAEISSADNDTDPNNAPPIEEDSVMDDIFANDMIGGDNIVDGTGGDEDDHDFADLPLVTISLTANTTQAVCNFDNGEISIDPASYTSYVWNDGGTGANRTGLFAEQYAVTVTDNFGCTGVLDSIELTNDCSLCVASAGTVTAAADTICMSGGSATISFTGDGNAVIPPSFVQVHFLTTGPEKTIQDFDSITNITDNFIVTAPGEYCITTKVFDIFHIPQEEIDSMQLGVTTLDFVGSFLAENGGYLCGSLSTVSTCVVVESCSSGPSNLSATVTEAVCNFDNGTISVTPDTYVSYEWNDGGMGPNRTGLFAGQYSVTATDVNGIKIILDSIELTNDCSLCPNAAGTVTAAADTICMTGGSATISFTEDGNSIMPPGYIDVHFLTTGAEQTIQYFDTTNAFVVTAPGEYCITTKVFDVLHVPQEEIDSMQLGVTQLSFVESFLIQGGGYLCGSLSTISTCVVVEACDLIDTVYFSLETDSVGTYCYDGLPGTFSNNITTTLCDGSLSGTDGVFGNYMIQETGCLVYTSNGMPGDDVDTICMIVSDDLGNVDTTIFIPTIFCHTPPTIMNVACDQMTMTGDFCFDVPFANISNYFVTVDGIPVSNGFSSCTGGNTSLTLSEGTHLVVIQEITEACAEASYQVNISCSPCMDILSMDTIQMVSPNCNIPTDVCIDISSANIFNYTILLDGSTYAGNLNSCDFAGSNDGTTIQVSQGTHELIVSEIATGCIDTMTIIIDCSGCPDLIPSNSVMQDYTCNDPIEVCLNLPMAELGDYTITDNGSFYNGSILSCNGTDVAVALDTGLHEVILLNNVSGCSDTMMLMIECVPNVIIIDTTIMVMGGDTLCLDTALVGDIANIDLTCGDTTISTTVNYFFDTLTNCIIFEGTAVGTDTLCFRIFNSNGERTDVFLYINVTPDLCSANVITQNSASLELTDCNGLAELCVDIPLDQILDYTITDNGVNYANSFAGCDFDTSLAYTYFTLPGQGTAGPYTVDAWSIDGTVFSGGFMTIDDLVDSMNVWDATGTWTVDSVSLIISGGNSSTTYGNISITQDATNAFALLELNVNLLPRGTVFFVSEGLHEIIVTDTATTCTDTIQVMVMCVQGDIIFDTITVGNITSTCIDTTDLLGTIDTMYNSCPTQSGEYVLFDIVDSTYCLNYEGMDIGTDTACIVLCDDLGVCDTTLVIVTVEPLLSNLPIAVTETDTTMMDEEIVINILGNDTLNGTLDTFYVVTPPDFGDLVLNVDGTATYTPNTGYCDQDNPDQYTYAICNENGCDTTTSFVYVLCNDPSDFQIYNGFSPNGDGLNDVFFIQGVEAYPNNVLCIFNRWGNQVFRQEGYLNTWSGDWETDIVPSGTYFYVFDTGEGDIYSGYVQIHR